MHPDPATLRATIATARPFHGNGFPPELRDQIATTAAALGTAGWSISAISRAIGISRKTLREFINHPTPTPDAPMRPITLAPPSHPPAVHLTLISPTGWRLEGLTLDDAARILAVLPC